MRMLVLAGGFGTRLQSVLGGEPKALASVGGVPFLRYQIEHWLAQGVSRFVFLLHHQAQRMIDFLESERAHLPATCGIEWVVEPVPLGTGGAVAHAVEKTGLTEDFLVCNADTWLGGGVEAMRQVTAPALAVVARTDTARYGRVRFDDAQRVVAFDEKEAAAGAGWINAGLYRLHPGLFGTWDGAPFSLEQQRFPDWAACGRMVAAPLRVDFIDIGIPGDYHRFCRWIADGRRETLCD